MLPDTSFPDPEVAMCMFSAQDGLSFVPHVDVADTRIFARLTGPGTVRHARRHFPANDARHPFSSREGAERPYAHGI